MGKDAGSARWSLGRSATGLVMLLLLVAVPLSVEAAQSKAVHISAPGKVVAFGSIKRLSAPKGAGIGGLNGFDGHVSAPGKQHHSLNDTKRFDHTVTKGPNGRILRVISPGAPQSKMPLPRPKPRRTALALDTKLPGGVTGGGPTRLRPGMRAMAWPLDGVVVSSHFGWRKHPVHGRTRMHYGVDVPARSGTPVRAAADGIVRFSGRNGGYGRFIRLDHGFGVETAYGHLRGYAKLLRPGKRVHRGELIGYVGSSGLSTGPHLHYEVRINGRAVDPMGYMPNAPHRVSVTH